MKAAAIIFAVLALGTGLIAAGYWFLSAKEEPPQMDALAAYIRDENQMTPVQRWLDRVAEKNRKAAGWSAVAVVLGAISSILGNLA